MSDKVAAFKRDTILDAAQSVFAERGYHRTTIKDIAARAGVADGTVYNYFDNKDALLSALFDRFQTGGSAGSASSTRVNEARAQLSIDPRTLELLRILISEMLVDEDLRNRYRDRFLAPIDLMNASADNPLAGRTAAATILGLMMLRLLDDPIVLQHWDGMLEMMKAIANEDGRP
jgi:AcrR family transcriptional regulator